MTARDELRRRVEAGELSMDEVRAVIRERKEEQLTPKELAAQVPRSPGDTPTFDPDDDTNPRALAARVPRDPRRRA